MPTYKAYLCRCCGSLMSLDSAQIRIYKKARLIKLGQTLSQCPYCIEKNIRVAITDEPKLVLGSRGRILSTTTHCTIKKKERQEGVLTRDEEYWLEKYRKTAVKSSSSGKMRLHRQLFEQVSKALKEEQSPRNFSAAIINELQDMFSDLNYNIKS